MVHHFPLRNDRKSNSGEIWGVERAIWGGGRILCFWDLGRFLGRFRGAAEDLLYLSLGMGFGGLGGDSTPIRIILGGGQLVVSLLELGVRLIQAEFLGDPSGFAGIFQEGL